MTPYKCLAERSNGGRGVRCQGTMREMICADVVLYQVVKCDTCGRVVAPEPV